MLMLTSTDTELDHAGDVTLRDGHVNRARFRATTPLRSFASRACPLNSRIAGASTVGLAGLSVLPTANGTIHSLLWSTVGGEQLPMFAVGCRLVSIGPTGL